MMNSQEIETAVRLRLHIVVLILKDNAYGMIKWEQAGMGLDDYGLDYGNLDFVKYAQSYGANGYRVMRTGDLGELMRQTLSEPGVHVIEIPMDYSENDRILTHELQERSRSV
ncbi:MAG: acetolactate synthase-1/2/3 large subunit [Planctomycetota bacterium]|jgi:acetolactate synthase-1/2/3 large subunit